MKGEERVGNSREGRKLREGNGVKGREGRKREGEWKGREGSTQYICPWSPRVPSYATTGRWFAVEDVVDCYC